MNNPYKLDKSENVEVRVGDYVEYNAGTWTEEDFQLIRDSEGSQQ